MCRRQSIGRVGVELSALSSVLRYAAIIMIAFQMNWGGIATVKTHIRRFLNRVHLTEQVIDLYHACIYCFDVRAHRENDRIKKQWPADMLSLPSPQLIYRVTGQYRIEPSLENGALGTKCIRGILAKNGLDIEDFQSILDSRSRRAVSRRCSGQSCKWFIGFRCRDS